MIGYENEPHQLYRLYDSDDRLLYVGITYDLRTRLRDHRRQAPWWPQVARATAEQHPRLYWARVSERAVIADEAPLHNRDRSLRPTDRSARQGQKVTKWKAHRALPEVPVDLQGCLGSAR